MADFTQALSSLLLADNGVSAIAGGRINWMVPPQGSSFPYIRLQVVSDPRPYEMDGPQAARETRVQVDCFAKSYGAARTLAQAVIAATDAPVTHAGVVFTRFAPEGPEDLGEDVAGIGFVHRMRLDLLIWHRLA